MCVSGACQDTDVVSGYNANIIRAVLRIRKPRESTQSNAIGSPRPARARGWASPMTLARFSLSSRSSVQIFFFFFVVAFFLLLIRASLSRSRSLFSAANCIPTSSFLVLRFFSSSFLPPLPPSWPSVFSPRHRCSFHLLLHVLRCSILKPFSWFLLSHRYVRFYVFCKFVEGLLLVHKQFYCP